MEEKGIEDRLVRRLEEMYEETTSVIRTKEGMTRFFQTRKGVKQGCVLSPLLFNIYIADIDYYMEKRGIGGIKLGRERIWTLAYADDLVIVAKSREAFRYVRHFQEFFKRKEGSSECREI